ncbi:hypothetical protein [uncultured Adlercreutzia sp.]|uniref:coiled-coil domain-containing protein n=1 Tax=uncultured Adlercreutzia sp. TaxID=875803 RepID=UPI0025DE7E67|nr:hypothetical protein [uncultured Adlercreutzia sp.]
MLCAALALLLTFSLLGAFPRQALAEPDDGSAAVADAQSALDAAESRMAQINEEYEALSAEVAELQKKIDETAASALEAQQAMLDGREALGQVAVSEYRDGSSLGLIGFILDAKNFDELLRNMEYAAQIMAYQADEVAEQKERKRAFDEVSDELNAQKSEQEEALAAQEEKRYEAQAVVEEATRDLSSAKEEHVARLAELAAQAEALRKQEEEAAAAAAAAAEESSEANTTEREPVVSDDEPVADDDDNADESAGSGSSGGSSEGSSSGSSSSNAGWKSGVASAYGGSTDPNTPNPGTTSTGATCDDWSMGVAVPKSLSNYRSYFGRTVEIVYGGQTVYATVNDCGSMGGGSRVLDLQPGVWKAFGFSSCKAWGLRTVKYRFL